MSLDRAPNDPLADLATADATAFADVLAAIYARRYTGPITLHFFSGVPNAIDIPADPVRIRLTRGGAVLDTSRR